MYVERATIRFYSESIDTSSPCVDVCVHVVADGGRWTTRRKHARAISALGKYLRGDIDSVLGREIPRRIAGHTLGTLALVCCDTRGAELGDPAIGNLMAAARKVSLHGCALDASLWPRCTGVRTLEIVASYVSARSVADVSKAFTGIKSLTLVGSLIEPEQQHPQSNPETPQHSLPPKACDKIPINEAFISIGGCIWLDRLVLCRHGLGAQALLLVCSNLDRFTNVQSLGVSMAELMRGHWEGTLPGSVVETTPHALTRSLLAYF